MARRTNYLAQAKAALASLDKVKGRQPTMSISTDDADASEPQSRRFESTFTHTTQGKLETQAKNERRAVGANVPRKRKKVRPEQIGCRAYDGTKAILLAIAKEHGSDQLTIGLEKMVAHYCEQRGWPAPGESHDA